MDTLLAVAVTGKKGNMSGHSYCRTMRRACHFAAWLCVVEKALMTWFVFALFVEWTVRISVEFTLFMTLLFAVVVVAVLPFFSFFFMIIARDKGRLYPSYVLQGGQSILRVVPS